MNINQNKPLFLSFIILLSTVPIVTTDMYLPAIPGMVTVLDAPLKLVNLTLVVFLLFFGGSSLIWGTLSDKYGRKPIVLASTSVYTLAGFLCATADGVGQLIVFRSLQGIGGGAAMAMAMAMVKDVYVGRERESVLVYQSSLMAVAPVIAPIVGAQVLLFTSWRGTFVILGLLGFLLFGAGLMLSETAERNASKSVLKTFGNLAGLVRTPGFIYPLLLVALAGMPVLLYVASASDIFITRFGLSEQRFSLFFGFNAALSIFGPFLYIALSKKLKTYTIFRIAYSMIALGGICITFFGHYGAILFAMAMMPTALAGSLIRPPSMNLLLEQGKRYAGSAAALMNFTFLATGSVGMVMISLNWNDRIQVFGLATLIVGLCAFLFWPKVWKKCQSPMGDL